MAGQGFLYTSDGGATSAVEDDVNDDYFGVQTPPTRSFMKLVPRAAKTQGGKLESKRSSGNKPNRSSSSKGLGPPQALHRQAHNASAARRQAKDRRQKARSQARFFKEIDTTLEALGIGTAGAAAGAGGSLGGAASGMPPSPCSSSVNLSLSLAPSADQLLTPTASSSRAGTPPPQAGPAGMGGISRRATSEQRLTDHQLPSGYSTPDRNVSTGGPPLVSFARGSNNGLLPLAAEPTGLPPRIPSAAGDRHHPALSMQLPAGHSQAEHTNGTAAHRRAVSAEGEPAAGAPYAGFMLHTAPAGEGGPAGPYQPIASRATFALPSAISTGSDMLANRDEFRRHIGHVIMGTAQSEEDLHDEVSQAEERAEPLHDEIEALHEEAELAADGGTVNNSSLDKMNTKLESLTKRARDALRKTKPLRSRLADHVDLLPRLNELLVRLWAGLVEAGEAVGRAGEALLAARGELQERGSDEDVRKSAVGVKKLLELIEGISKRSSEDLDAANEAVQAQTLTAACQAAAVSLNSACIQAAAQAAPVLLQAESLSTDSFVHEKNNQAKRLCALWDEAARLTEKTAKRYCPGFRLRLYSQLAAALLEAGELALAMMQQAAAAAAEAAAAGTGAESEAGGDLSDAASDSGVDTDTSRGIQAGSAWGARVASAWGGRKGPAGRGGVTDKEIEAQAWVPNLLQMLLHRASETHKWLREALHEASRVRSAAEGSLDLDEAEEGSLGLGAAMGSGASVGGQSGQAPMPPAAREEALFMDASEVEELFDLLDTLQEVFAELCVANLKRTMRLCSGSTGEPLSVWALESARDAAEAALRFVYIHDNSSMALGDMLYNEVTDKHKAWLQHTWQEYTRLSQGVVNGLLSVRRQINVRKGSLSPPPAAPPRLTAAAAIAPVTGAGRGRPLGSTAPASARLPPAAASPAGASVRASLDQAAGWAPGTATTAQATAVGAPLTYGLGRRRPPPAPKLSLPSATGAGANAARSQPFSPVTAVCELPWGQAANTPQAAPHHHFGSIAAAAGGAAPGWAAGSSSAALVAAELGAAAVAAAAAAAAAGSGSASAASVAESTTAAAPSMWKAALLAPAGDAVARGHASARSSFESGEPSSLERARKQQGQPAAELSAAAEAGHQTAGPSDAALGVPSWASTARRRDPHPNQQARLAAERGASVGRGATRGGLSARGGGSGGRGSGRLFGRGRGRLARGDDDGGGNYVESDPATTHGAADSSQRARPSHERREAAGSDGHRKQGAGAASNSTRPGQPPAVTGTAGGPQQPHAGAAPDAAAGAVDAPFPVSTPSSWAAVAARGNQGGAPPSGSGRLPSANTMRSPFASSSAASRAASGVAPAVVSAPVAASPFAAIAMQPPPASPTASASPSNSHAPSPQHTPHQSAPTSPSSRSAVNNAPDAGVALVSSPSLTPGGMPQVTQQPPPVSATSTLATSAGVQGCSGASTTTSTAATSASSAFQFAPVSTAATTSSSGQPRANGAASEGSTNGGSSGGKRTPKLGSPHASGHVMPPPAAVGISSAAVLAADARGPGASGMAIADAAGPAELVWTAVASSGAHPHQNQHQRQLQPQQSQPQPQQQARGGYTPRPGQGPGQVGTGPKAVRTASLTAQVSLGHGGLGPAAPAASELARQGSEGLTGHVVRNPELAALLHAIACDPFWSIRWSDLSSGLSTLVGNGSTGQVFAGTYLHGEVAIKVIGINRDMEYDLAALRAFKAEVDLNKLLNQHPNIVRFIGVCADYIQYAARQAGLLTDADLVHTRWAAPPRALPSRDGRPFAPMLAIVMEYCHLGTLWTMIGEARRLSNAAARGQQVGRTSSNRWGFSFWKSWERRLEVLCGAAAGLEYMHKNHVIHHDFTSYNLLLDERGGKWTTKVCDFNLSRVVSRQSGGAPASGGASSLTVPNSGNMYSPRWQSPEYLEGKEYATATDVFSFGVVLWEVVTLQTPWENELHQYENKGLKVLEPVFIHEEVVTKNKRLTFPTELEPELPELPQLVALCEGCWHKDPRSRPRMTEVAEVLTAVLSSWALSKRVALLAPIQQSFHPTRQRL
ncbi:hypothetical protein HYH02_007786 [Chlamydomonas schloesseri]|uniref:Protein kinase domain-containing protein n=1 Tax=Chlamydomonas schloesseri TaxID=2026947 RepID=A0A835WI92_9CHLO|nr:hypothetical protein HYH02_007786 [Chlamydomonas schloesseri]|eukprot:KAG2447465.1 hypothetical protein HYH02_007786 [Chlamydomonas schloesseri]